MEDLPLKPPSTRLGMRAQYRAIHRLTAPRKTNRVHPSKAARAIAIFSVRIPAVDQLLGLRQKRQERQEQQQKGDNVSGSGGSSGGSEHIPPYTFVLSRTHDLGTKLDFSWRESFRMFLASALSIGFFMMVLFYPAVLAFRVYADFGRAGIDHGFGV